MLEDRRSQSEKYNLIVLGERRGGQKGTSGSTTRMSTQPISADSVEMAYLMTRLAAPEMANSSKNGFKTALEKKPSGGEDLKPTEGQIQNWQLA
jgi:hypothetical protein